MVAIVTGGSFSIGCATPIAFTKRGAKKSCVAGWMEDHRAIVLMVSDSGDISFFSSL